MDPTDLDQKSYIDKIYEFTDDEDVDLNSCLEFNKFSQASNKKEKVVSELSSDESMQTENESDDPYEEIDESNDMDALPVNEQEDEPANQNFRSYADLNDYVLFDIFDLLSLTELQQCRTVCKKFRVLIDKIKFKKLSLSYFSNKYSWSSDENFHNLQQYSDSIDVKSLSSFSNILNKPQFKDLEHLILVTEYANNKIDLNTDLFEFDISKFASLNNLELFGSYIVLKEECRSQTLTHLSIENVNVDLFELFPNLVYLRCNVLKSNHTNANLKYLDYFTRSANLIDHSQLFKMIPNCETLGANFLDAYSFLNNILSPEDCLFNKLKVIKVYFNNFLCYEQLIDFLIHVTNFLKIKLEFHITSSKTKGELIKWSKFFQSRNIQRFIHGQTEVNLDDLNKLPNYENNTLLKESLKIDQNSLQNISLKVYPYLFNTNRLELNSEGMENEFNYLIKTMPCITKLVINFRLQQSTFDRIKDNCRYLNHIKIINTKQAFKLDLTFIYFLDHLTSIELTNLDLFNCSVLRTKIKFSKFFQNLHFKNCRLDLDYCDITQALVQKARKNIGKFFEIHILPVQDNLVTKFNNMFNDSPENFYSNIFRF